MSQRVTVNGPEFARRREFQSGEVRLVNLDRMRDLLVADDPRVRYQMTGSVGARGECLLRLEIEGVVPVQCQRCMERLDYRLAVDVVFELLAEDAEPTQEEMEDDSRDYLPATTDLDVLALVEDEMLLALPPAPRHEDCSIPRSSAGEDRALPFGDLAVLKQRMH